MKAISLWQPWASLWLSSAKIHETRHWETRHRGRLLVHAAKKFVKDVPGELDDILSSEFGNHWGLDLPTGAIVGMVDLVSIARTDQMPPEHVGTDDYLCGDFSPHRFAWRRGSYWRFPTPVVHRGYQSIFEVQPDLVREQIEASKEVTE